MCRRLAEAIEGRLLSEVGPVEATIESVLKEHLPYELDMLEQCFVRLHTKEQSEQLDQLTKNALVEAFWVHARILSEFLKQAPKGAYASGIVSAKALRSGVRPT
jgi:hypothetical protein